MSSITKQEALDYHKYPRPGKIEVDLIIQATIFQEYGLPMGKAYSFSLNVDPKMEYIMYGKWILISDKIAL